MKDGDLGFRRLETRIGTPDPIIGMAAAEIATAPTKSSANRGRGRRPAEQSEVENHSRDSRRQERHVHEDRRRNRSIANPLADKPRDDRDGQ